MENSQSQSHVLRSQESAWSTKEKKIILLRGFSKCFSTYKRLSTSSNALEIKKGKSRDV